MRFNVALALCIVLLTVRLNGQTIEFSKIYKVWCEFSNNNFEQTSDGGYVICSDAVPEMDTLTPNPKAYGYLIKLNAFGNPQWMKKFEKSNATIKPMDGNSVIQTHDGGYAIGTSYYLYDTVAGQYRTYSYIIRTDAFGNHIWSKLYGGIGNSRALCIIETANHDLVVCGSTTDSANAANHGNFLLRTDSAGNVLWATGFSTGSTWFNSGEFSTVIETANGDLVACGSTVINGLIVRFDPAGNIIWSKRNPAETITDIAEEPNGNLMGVGYTSNFTYTVYLEMDSSGTGLNSNYYGTNSYHGSSIVCTWDGATIVGDGMGNGSLLMHISNAGTVLWNVIYTDADGMLRPDLELTDDSGYAFAAQNWGPAASSAFDWAVIMIKTDSLGDIPCHDTSMTIPQYTFPAPSNVNLYTTSGTTVSSMNTLMMPVLVHDSDMCANEPDAIVEQSSVPSVSVFPNPATNEVNISVRNSSCDQLAVTLYNAEGQLLQSGAEPRIDLTPRARGLYFIEIQCNGEVIAREKVIRE